MSYMNSCFSEYIGSHIFQSVGMKAQDTLLGTFKLDGEEKIVVACKDFTQNNVVLQDFTSLKNSVIHSSQSGYGIELPDLLESMEQQFLFDKKELKEHFWNMFVIDTLIGNWNRHNGNWGFLYNTQTDEIELAPICDCGSCLFPSADENIMRATIEQEADQQYRVFEIPLSCIKENGEKIKYFDFIYSLKNKDCNAALKRMTKRIDLKQINNIIEETPYITDLQKNFYKTILKARKEKILDKSLKKLLYREKTYEEAEQCSPHMRE